MNTHVTPAGAHWPRIIGMLHAPPLPGSPAFAGDLSAVHDHVLRDAQTLADGGVDALMLENFGDSPFYPGRVPAETVAHVTALASAVRGVTDLPLGINVLRNDGRSALAVAHAAGGSFIRVNVLCGAAVTDQGIIEGIAHDLLRDRAQLDARDIRIMADVHVKHAAPLAERPLADEVVDLVHRGRADAVIVSGGATGAAVDLDELRTVKSAAGDAPVYVGSGATTDNAASLLDVADGLIVGTALKRDGDVDAPVDPERVAALMSAAG